MITTMQKLREISWIYCSSKSRQRWKICVSWEWVPYWQYSTRKKKFFWRYKSFAVCI